jgi:hypothetical protein
MHNRLKPYGGLRPRGISRAHVTAYLLGIRDGWRQPYQLDYSTHVEHLSDDFMVQDTLDAGINLGQWLRSPLNHQRQEDGAVSLAVIAAVAILGALIGLWISPGRAYSVEVRASDSSTNQPYGGCKEAWQAPRSAGAQWCRDHGWTVRRNLVVSPKRVVRYDAMPECRHEDGSGQRAACSWNFWGHSNGNGRGLSYWEHKGTVHYVWPSTPVNSTWRWVTAAEGDAFDRMGTRDGFAGPKRDRVTWTQCVTKRRDFDTKCPNGVRIR